MNHTSVHADAQAEASQVSHRIYKRSRRLLSSLGTRNVVKGFAVNPACPHHKGQVKTHQLLAH